MTRTQTNWINGGGRITHKDVLDKLDRIELCITEARMDEKPGTFAWCAYLEAALAVRECRRRVAGERGATPRVEVVGD